MLTQLLAPLLSLAILASASPFPATRQTEPPTGNWCAGLGGDTIDNLGEFTLAAWNPASSNANATGNPLVLSNTGATGGFSTHTWAVSTQKERTYAENLSVLDVGLVPIQRLAKFDNDERRHQGKRTRAKRRHGCYERIAHSLPHNKCLSGGGSRPSLLCCCM